MLFDFIVEWFVNTLILATLLAVWLLPLLLVFYFNNPVWMLLWIPITTGLLTWRNF